MARPTKQGLDYFPFDVDFFNDDKIQLIEAEFGAKGCIIAIKLLSKIYKENGYFYQWGEDQCLLFSKNAGCGIDIDLVKEVINGLFKRGIFDIKIFETYQVLTSSGIQKRFFEASKKRTDLKAIKEYLVIDELTTINSKIIIVNLENKQVKVEISTQRKENNSKENNSKENNILSPIGGAPKINSLENDYKNLEKTTEPIVNFIKNNKPEFIEPYFDCWNLFAEKYKLAKIISITSRRKKKFNIRIKETDFNFIEILKKAGKSEFITTNGKWFGFDWLLENESNYLKVLEGNYGGKEIDAENKPENSKQMTYEEYELEMKKLTE